MKRPFRRHALRVLITLACVALGSTTLAYEHDKESPERPLWQWTPEEIAKKVKEVRAGDDLTPKTWPGGRKVAVSLSFDVDTEPAWMGVAAQRSPSYLSRGEYGARVGVPRIIRLLEKHEITASFFIPAMTMVLHPEVVQELRKHPQYEIGFHSYAHENPLTLSAAEERGVYEKAMKIFVEHVGRRPVGFRSASWDLTASTIKLVQEMGFLYESSMMADDRPYRLISEGRDTGLVELPVEWFLADWPFFQISWPSGHVGIRNTEDVYSIWKEEFDGAYEEGTMYILTMHPQVIGHRHRLQMLDRLITYMKSKSGVWFATHEEIARYVLTQPQQSP